MQNKSMKCVVVGDGVVGKTSLLVTYLHKKFPEDYVPTVVDTYSTEVSIGNGKTCSLTLFDSAGQEDYDYLRPLSYPRTNVFLVCFSIDLRSSYENVKLKWVPEIRHHCPNIPFLLIGTKIDLRSQQTIAEMAKRNEKPITTEEGKKLAEQLNAVTYLECSAKTYVGLKSVFDNAILTAIQPKKSKPKTCKLL